MTTFNNPASCHEYKEYSKKWLPQNKILADYAVSDFKVDPEARGDTFDQLNKYVITLEEYSKRLTTAAFLRQTHFEKYILGKHIEEPDHAYWRIGLNRVSEDAQNKLTYWLNFKDQMLTNLIEDDNVKKTIENKRTCADVDFNIRNVDYDSKIQSKQIVYRPKISKSEKKKNRKIRLKEEEELRKAVKEKKEEENKLLDELIHCSTKMKELYKQEFVDNGGILVSSLIKELKENPLSDSIIFRNALLHPNRQPDQIILIDFETSENMYELAGIYFNLRNSYTESMLIDLSYIFYYKDFRKVYVDVAFRDMEYNENTREGIFALMRHFVDGEIDYLKRYYTQRYAKDLKSKQLLINFLDMLYNSRHTLIIYERLLYLRQLEKSIDEPIDFDEFQSRLNHLTEQEQLLFVDSDIMEQYLLQRTLICDLLELDEQEFIDIDKKIKKTNKCKDPSCRNCYPICYCKSCHKKFKND